MAARPRARAGRRRRSMRAHAPRTRRGARHRPPRCRNWRPAPSKIWSLVSQVLSQTTVSGFCSSTAPRLVAGGALGARRSPTRSRPAVLPERDGGGHPAPGAGEARRTVTPRAHRRLPAARRRCCRRRSRPGAGRVTGRAPTPSAAEVRRLAQAGGSTGAGSDRTTRSEFATRNDGGPVAPAVATTMNSAVVAPSHGRGERAPPGRAASGRAGSATRRGSRRAPRARTWPRPAAAASWTPREARARLRERDRDRPVPQVQAVRDRADPADRPPGSARCAGTTVAARPTSMISAAVAIANTR